jgi:lysozyme family protein
MASGNFKLCLDFVLQFEGGYVNNPDDPGGPTNLGVTQATLSTYLGRQAAIAEVKALTPATVAPIYRLKFWDHVSGDQLPIGVDLAVFDFGVHSGPKRGIIGLQRALGGLADDGNLGPLTLAAAAAADPAKLIGELCDERLKFLQGLSVFKKFQAGLTNRVANCRDAALSMLQ